MGVTLINPNVFPVTTKRISGTTVQMWTSSDVSISNVFPFYYYDSSQVCTFSAYGTAQMSVSDCRTLVAYTVTDPDVTAMDTDLAYVPVSIAGSYSADLIPLVIFKKASTTNWYTGWVDLSYEYLVPKSKLDSYSVGDKFPRSSDLDIDAILDAIDNSEVEYIQALESASGINSSSVGQYWQNVQNWQNAAGQLGATDDTQSGILALVPFFAAFPLFGAFLLVLVAFGVLYLLIKKAVS